MCFEDKMGIAIPSTPPEVTKSVQHEARRSFPGQEITVSAQHETYEDEKQSPGILLQDCTTAEEGKVGPKHADQKEMLTVEVESDDQPQLHEPPAVAKREAPADHEDGHDTKQAMPLEAQPQEPPVNKPATNAGKPADRKNYVPNKKGPALGIKPFYWFSKKNFKKLLLFILLLMPDASSQASRFAGKPVFHQEVEKGEDVGFYIIPASLQDPNESSIQFCMGTKCCRFLRGHLTCDGIVLIDRVFVLRNVQQQTEVYIGAAYPGLPPDNGTSFITLKQELNTTTPSPEEPTNTGTCRVPWTLFGLFLIAFIVQFSSEYAA